MAEDETIDRLWEQSNHGTRREDIEAAYNAGAEAEREARSKLFEAAPDLLDACKAVEMAYKIFYKDIPNVGKNPSVELCIKAIAKATPRSNV